MATYLSLARDMYGPSVESQVWDAYMKRVRRNYKAAELREKFPQVLADFGQVQNRYYQIRFYVPDQTVSETVALAMNSLKVSTVAWAVKVRCIKAQAAARTHNYRDSVKESYGGRVNIDLWPVYYSYMEEQYSKSLYGVDVLKAMSDFPKVSARCDQLLAARPEVGLREVVKAVLSRLNYTDEQWRVVVPDVANGMQTPYRRVYVSAYTKVPVDTNVFGCCITLPPDYSYELDAPLFESLKRLVFNHAKQDIREGASAFEPENTTILGFSPMH